MFGKRRNRRLDRILHKAYRLYKDDCCRDCGQPAIWTFNPRLERYFSISANSPVCYTCALVHMRTHDQTEPMEPGAKIVFENQITAAPPA